MGDTVYLAWRQPIGYGDYWDSVYHYGVFCSLEEAMHEVEKRHVEDHPKERFIPHWQTNTEVADPDWKYIADGATYRVSQLPIQ